MENPEPEPEAWADSEPKAEADPEPEVESSSEPKAEPAGISVCSSSDWETVTTSVTTYRDVF